MQGILLTKAGGLLGPIAGILGVIMNIIFEGLSIIGIHNIGISIILFTIIVNVLMLPMTIKQQKFSKLSAKMNPEIQAIQKKYKGKTDQASMMKQNEETKAVYDKYGTSPTGSCLQLLIQMPILFSLYKVIYAIPAYVDKFKAVYTDLVNKIVNTEAAKPIVEEVLGGFKNSARYVKQFGSENIESVKNAYIDCLNMASSTEWDTLANSVSGIDAELGTLVSNTSQKVAEYNQFLGLNIGNSPMDIIKEGMSNGAYLLVLAAIMIPVLAAFTQWLNTKLMPTANTNNDSENPMANSMKTMNIAMPLMSAVFCFGFPSGIGLYWIAGAVVRCIQQIAVNKYIDKHIDFDELIRKNKDIAIEKAKKRKAKNAELMAQAEALSKAANKKTKNISAKANMGSTMNAEEREAKMKEIDKYSKTSQKSAKGSIAAKANLVKDYNDNNR